MSQSLLLKPRSVESLTGIGEALSPYKMSAVMYASLIIHDTVPVGRTLQAKVQAKLNGNWQDVVAFSSQGDGPARQRISKVIAGIDQAEVSNVPSGGNVFHLLSDQIRARWLIAGGAFDFSIRVDLEAR